MGKQGSGKSTLAALLMRWRTATTGSVAIDGIEISQYDRSYTDQVGAPAPVRVVRVRARTVCIRNVDSGLGIRTRRPMCQ